MSNRRDNAIRKLYEAQTTLLYSHEVMRVLELNRQRERGTPGRIFLARDIQARRTIQGGLR